MSLAVKNLKGGRVRVGTSLISIIIEDLRVPLV